MHRCAIYEMSSNHYRTYGDVLGAIRLQNHQFTSVYFYTYKLMHINNVMPMDAIIASKHEINN
jgi:hypothetical protein